jgi:peptide/nickel transport system substrate-binding protein
MVAPESAPTNAENPIGTGPFAFSRWRRGDRVELARNPDYWGEAPALAGVTFKFISDPTAAMSALLARDVDAFPNVPAPESVAQFQNDPRFTVEVGTTEGETILAMNSARAPFDTVEVRRALSHAIDRQSIVDGAMFGFGTPIGSHFAPHHPAYVDLTGIYPYDPEKVRAMLREAGVAEGTRMTLKLPPPTYARRGGEIVAAQLRDVGLDVELIPLEWAQWLEEVFKGKDYDLTIVSHTEPLDIDIYARDDYYFHVEDPAFDEIMGKLDAESDPEKRLELLGEAQRRIAENAVNGFLFQLAKIGIWDADLEGLWSNAPVQANDMTKVRWKS